ncbi:MAG: TetR/AcrR family transcriptional regulator [Actinomycetota bacterium]
MARAEVDRVASSRRRVAKPADERREDLLAAARRVFAEKGLPNATIADVTEAAGVAKGTFYLHFDSKEALLGALKQRFVDDLVSRALQLYTTVGHDDWWALADVTVESMIDYLLEHRDLIQVFARDGFQPQSSALFGDASGKLRNMFAAGIKAGTDAGAFDAADPVLTATFLDHAIHGTVEHAVLYEGGIDRDYLVAGAKELLRRVLRGS